MQNETGYSIPDTVLAAHLEGEAVLLDMESKEYFRLNGTGALIWKALERGAPRTAIIAELTEIFEVTREEAARELERLLGELAEAGLIAAGSAS
jgi:hypothetical protein